MKPLPIVPHCRVPAIAPQALMPSLKSQCALVATALVILALAPSAVDAKTMVADGPEFQINTYTTSSQFIPAVGSDGSGGFVVVWYSDGSGGSDNDDLSVQGQRYGSDGSTTGGEFQVNTYSTGYQGFPSVGSDGSGGFVVVWHSYGSLGSDNDNASIQGQRYASDGSTAGGEFQVNTYTTGTQSVARVGPDGSGGFVVVWHSNGSSGSDNNSNSIQGQRYASDGSVVGSEFQVNTFTTSTQLFPTVGSDGFEGFVVVWESAGSSGSDNDLFSIQGQRYASDGSTVGSEFQVNTYTTGNQILSRVGLDGSTGFVVVWESAGSSGSDNDLISIQGQRYASDGSVVGSEFQVNIYTTANQLRPMVVADDSGGFVVVWRSSGSLGSDTTSDSIQGQRFASNGSPVDGQFQVNTYTPTDQQDSAVGPDGSGGFVVAWSSFGSSGNDTDGWSVQGQRYSPRLFADGFESGDTNAWSNTVP